MPSSASVIVIDVTVQMPSTFAAALAFLGGLTTTWAWPTLATPLVVALIFVGLAIHALPPRAGETVARALARLPSPATALAFGLCVLMIEAIRPEGVAPFIYFQF